MGLIRDAQRRVGRIRASRVDCGLPDRAAYGSVCFATQAFVLSFAETLREEVAYATLRVICPCDRWPKINDRAAPPPRHKTNIDRATHDLCVQANSSRQRAQDVTGNPDIALGRRNSPLTSPGYAELPYRMVLRVRLLARSSGGADRDGSCDIEVRTALQAPPRMFASARTVVAQGSTLALCIGPDESGSGAPFQSLTCFALEN